MGSMMDRKDKCFMYKDIYIDEEKRKEKKRLQIAGSILIWIVMIGLSVFLASRSLMVG